jgi:hypothetical protein
MSPVGFEPTIPAFITIIYTKSVCLHQTDKEEFTPPFNRMVYKTTEYNCLQQIYMFFHTQFRDYDAVRSKHFGMYYFNTDNSDK